MINLILGILFFNLILILFKLFDRYKVDNLQAIVVNYLVAGFCGFQFSGLTISTQELIQLDWLYIAFMIGSIFVIVFNMVATGAQKIGMAITTVANKMSVILPVIASFFLYGDKITLLKIGGIILALIGVYLSTMNGKKLNFDRSYLWLLALVFFGQGVADILFNYAQEIYVEPTEAEIFIAMLFFAAFVTGSLILITKVIQKKEKLRAKNLLWGIALGIPNYLTVFYFFKALESDFMESSQVYPILNMGVIVMSAITGFLLFREKLSTRNWIGIGLSVVAIAAISLG
jgi:drug/metabolite transporter (DMT)-like permease